MGIAQTSFAKAYNEIKPDIIIVLGDRYEIFSAAAAAMIARIPIAHIHGGEKKIQERGDFGYSPAPGQKAKFD